MIKMKKLVEVIPIPISGLMLALAALGNYMGSFSSNLRYFLGSISSLLLILLSAKIIMNFEQIKISLNNPVTAGVMSTYPMTMMILSTYIVKFNELLARGLFFFGIGLHLCLILFFIKKYLFKFDINKVFPTHFIVFTGITCASVASKALSMKSVGIVFFWVGLIGLIIMYPLVTKRVITNKLNNKIFPIIAIYTAPASLCLAGYMSTYNRIDTMFYLLLGFVTLNLMFVLMQIPKIMQVGFNPTYSALTFPFVITAIAIKTSKVSKLYVDFTAVLAIGLVSYVLFMYAKKIFIDLSHSELKIESKEILT